MDPTSVATITVATIAAASAWASQRSAARASEKNTSTTSRVEMEKEAYTRARAFDIQTIQNQNVHIAELRKREDDQAAEIDALRRRVAKLERELILLRGGDFSEQPDDPFSE